MGVIILLVYGSVLSPHVPVLQGTQTSGLEKKFRDALGQHLCQDPVTVCMLSIGTASFQKFLQSKDGGRRGQAMRNQGALFRCK